MRDMAHISEESQQRKIAAALRAERAATEARVRAETAKRCAEIATNYSSRSAYIGSLIRREAFPESEGK